MSTFIKSTKDNKKLYGKTVFCLKIYLKLMDVGYIPIQPESAVEFVMIELIQFATHIPIYYHDFSSKNKSISQYISPYLEL
ncbi:hypothetical protein CN988_25020 [Bacillus thuringiensis]|nr:hypothetical protein CON42_01390 [Bacillus thuringiensis]PER53762.1 hypothetical protein CN486_21605 [Bacillus thuringiensis]PEV61429.1 hypothetical protein CN434_29650 [Bacillus thuringiensis]PEV86358.1 hypothetical protein CN442_26325 [Bacillus thuringiensis]PFF27074.1 hypothetical protein CN332_07890 [Bacillus thuringiensis]